MEPTLMALLGILRVSNKYCMENAGIWSIRRLRQRLPVDPNELYNRSHFDKLREGRTAVDLIHTSLRCGATEFLPYAYFALATLDWRDRKALMDRGWHQLNIDQILKLTAARGVLHAKFTEVILLDASDAPQPLVMSPNPNCQRAVEGGGPCHGMKTRIRTAPNNLTEWAARADLIYWVKSVLFAIDSLKSMCSSCKACARAQGEAKMKEVFVDFCKTMEIQYPGEKKRKRGE